MVKFLKYIFSRLCRKNNYIIRVIVEKTVIKKTIYIKEKDSTSAPSKPE